MPASIAFGHPNADLSGIFLKPLRDWDYPNNLPFVPKRRCLLVHNKSVPLLVSFKRFSSLTVTKLPLSEETVGGYLSSDCYSHEEGGNYGKDQADCSRVFHRWAKSRRCLCGSILSSAAVLTEMEKAWFWYLENSCWLLRSSYGLRSEILRDRKRQ